MVPLYTPLFFGWTISLKDRRVRFFSALSIFNTNLKGQVGTAAKQIVAGKKSK
jgi:hypothetical protein